MPCYSPLTAFYNEKSGGVFWTEKQRQGETRTILLPCRRCVGCRLQSANDWATRCGHEAQMHTANCFGTFTWEDEKLKTQSLVHRDWQLFMKKLRNALGREWSIDVIEISESLYQRATASSRSATHRDDKENSVTRFMGFHPIPQLKFYMAGEYGDRTRRPHFHACLFGIDFKDKKFWKTNPNGDKVYTSETLTKIWGNGFTTLGNVTYESAAYIARYIMEKKTGQNAGKYYEHVDLETGEITDLKPEYNKMSLSEGIGKRWINQYETDVYPHGYVITRGTKNKAPRYYDKLYKRKEPENHAEMKTQREYEAAKKASDNTEQRLEAKKQVKLAQISQLKRTL